MVTSATATRSLQDEIDDLIGAFPGRVGLAAADLTSGARLDHRSAERFPTASAIKLPLLTVVHDLVAQGELDWDGHVEVPAGPGPGGSGVLQHLDRPRSVTLRDAAWLMICVSDNLATNVVLDRIGIERAARRLQDLVGPDVVLDKPAGSPDPGEPPTRSMGRATPEALLTFLLRLDGGDHPGAADTLTVAGQQQSRLGIGRYLPLASDRADGRGVSVMNKPGALPGVRTDIGVVRSGGRRVALAVLTDDGPDTGYGPDQVADRLIGSLALTVCRHWLGINA